MHPHDPGFHQLLDHQRFGPVLCTGHVCDGIDGKSSTWWVGLLKAGYYLPQIITIVGQIFYEAWQLSAVTEESERSAFFSKVFRVYAAVMFCCVAGVIWLCQPMMHVFREDYFLGWQFVPFLTLASMCTCLNNFLNSVYVVYKRSTSSSLHHVGRCRG